MGFTFDFLVVPYKYEYKAKNKTASGHRLIVFSNDFNEFIKELTLQGLYDEYRQEQDKDIKVHSGQMTLDDYL